MYRDGEAPAHSCTRRTLIRTSLGLGAGATLTTVGLSGCTKERKNDGATQRVQKSDVPVGGGTLVGWYVVTQPTAGTFHAYYAACPHAGVKVDRIEGAGNRLRQPRRPVQHRQRGRAQRSREEAPHSCPIHHRRRRLGHQHAQGQGMSALIIVES